MTTVTTTDRTAAFGDALAAALGSTAEVVPASGPEPGTAGTRLAVGTVGHISFLAPEGVPLDDVVAAATATLTATFGVPAGQGEPADEPGDTFAPGCVGFRIPLEAGTVTVVLDESLLAALPEPQATPTVAPAAFPDLGRGAQPNGERDLSVLSDVTMSVTVELGRARLKVRDLLGLSEGSVIELDRAAGAAVDVLVNGTVVARGDVVVIDDDLGVRITEVVERQ